MALSAELDAVGDAEVSTSWSDRVEHGGRSFDVHCGDDPVHLELLNSR